MGAALTSDTDLYYRNLGGTATLHTDITPHIGTLDNEVRATQVSSSGGMIIHKFTFAMTAQGTPVYTGETTFGFFTAAALAQQIGLRQVDPALHPSPKAGLALPYPDAPRLPRPPLRMVDGITQLGSWIWPVARTLWA